MFTEFDVIGLGMACVDVAIRMEELPSWEHDSVVTGFTLADGGAAGTACCAAAILGLRTGLVETFGTDEMATRKVDALKRAGVDVSRMVKREGPEDNVVVVYVHEPTGERSFGHGKGMRTRPVRPEELDRHYITSGRFLHMDATHVEAGIQAARWMHEAGKTVVLDAARTSKPVHPQVEALVAVTDILICGSGFAPMLTGRKDVREAGRAALDKGPSIVVQTEGAEGSYTVSAEGEFHTPAFKVNVVDTTGAGDVFHGAYLVGLVKGWDLERIATFASAVSAIHCTALGNRKGIPTFQEVEAFLKQRERQSN